MKRTFAYLLAIALTILVTTSCGDDDSSEGTLDAGKDSGTAQAVCGNGKVEGTELCDGSDLNNETCATVGDGIYTTGSLFCTSKCVFNVSLCHGEDSGMKDMEDGGGGTGH
jgi:hypothetical protein